MPFNLTSRPLRYTLPLALIIVALAGCAAKGSKEEIVQESEEIKAVQEASPSTAGATLPPPLEKAEQELVRGITSYEDGAYKLATRQLQSALALGLGKPGDKAMAHKYLAFMHCVAGRKKLCQNEFSKALAITPEFDLSPAEAGHPTWGPLFRKLKKTGIKPEK